MIPEPRKDNLVTQESGEGLLVYVLESNRAICLNRISNLVWQKCDGEKSPWEIQKKLKTDVSLEISEDKIWAALTNLRDYGLLAPDAEQVIDHYKPFLANTADVTPQAPSSN